MTQLGTGAWVAAVGTILIFAAAFPNSSLLKQARKLLLLTPVREEYPANQLRCSPFITNINGRVSNMPDSSTSLHLEMLAQSRREHAFSKRVFGRFILRYRDHAMELSGVIQFWYS